ncbi:MAG: bifunctional hydroxymethylpyrimidine kinase/phosphomethylpyrimidine kinase [Gemmatimonadaceae bacterium]
MIPIALTIAGSDSGGGAGIQADLKTFHRFGVFGTSVITAITAQNTRGVADWRAVDRQLVTGQLDAVASDLRPHAVKSGMLGDAHIVRAVAEGVARHQLVNYVLDPVMVATSGDLLLEPDAVNAIRDALLPLASLVTPNLDEARVLTGTPVRTPDEMSDAARSLVSLGARAALIKGGHLDDPDIVDIFFDGTELRQFRSARIDTLSLHGTGCTLSAAIVAGLALGNPMERAVIDGLAFVHRAIATAPGLGDGHGPLNHWA